MAFISEMQEKDWNMNLAWMQEIMRQIAKCHDLREQANLFAWWNSLRSIYGMMHYDMLKPGHEEEEQQLRDLLAKADSIAFRIELQGAKESMHKLLDTIEFKLKYLILAYDYVLLKPAKSNPDTAIEDEM